MSLNKKSFKKFYLIFFSLLDRFFEILNVFFSYASKFGKNTVEKKLKIEKYLRIILRFILLVSLN